MKKKIVLLDLGGVVFQLSGKSNEEVNWKIIWELNSKYGAEMDLGGNGFGDFLVEYNKLTNQNLKGTEFLEKVFDTLDFNEELIEFLIKGRDIIIVSDNYRENIDYIAKRYDFADWSIMQRYSFDYKMYKSNPDFFVKLLEDIKDHNIKDLIFIDDSESKLNSALKSGIMGIQYKNNEQIIEDLKEHGY